MSDIKSPRLLYFKGGLMLVVGILASALLIAPRPDFATVALLAVAVWGFCRAYYFAFYVIQHYIDPDYRYAGLTSFVRYSLGRKKPGDSAIPASLSNPCKTPPAEPSDRR
jgi:hypothetical protein